jgi:hypothetical protein
MKLLQKIKPEWALRIGLGLTYLYSGSDLIIHPTAWYWALPYWLKQTITSVVPLNTYLQIQGSIEIIFALILLAWFVKPKIVYWVAVIASLEFSIILLLALIPWSEANFLVTFRDIGLLGASAALASTLKQKVSGSSVIIK